jgi:hypothetical protein
MEMEIEKKRNIGTYPDFLLACWTKAERLKLMI